MKEEEEEDRQIKSKQANLRELRRKNDLVEVDGVTFIKCFSKKEGEIWIKNGSKEQVKAALDEELKQGYIETKSYNLALDRRPPLVIDRIKFNNKLA
jgi:hypothetical protein